MPLVYLEVELFGGLTTFRLTTFAAMLRGGVRVRFGVANGVRVKLTLIKCRLRVVGVGLGFSLG